MTDWSGIVTEEEVEAERVWKRSDGNEWGSVIFNEGRGREAEGTTIR